MDNIPYILIVDDCETNIRLIGAVLQKENYHLIIAQDGEMALQALEKMTPNLILLDISMPNMDGYEVCRRIKMNSKFQAVSIIFMTAKTEEQDIVKGFEVGCADYITKPFNSNILLSRVRTHLKLYEYHQYLEQQAYLDCLTQLPNRLSFDKVLVNEWNRNSRTHNNVAAILLDIDFFKSINDQHGHLEGDYALKHVASVLKQEVKRAGDFVARFGGEEFVILLANSGLNDAALFAERIRVKIEALDVKSQNEKSIKVTVSAGVASTVPDRIHDPLDLINNADTELYRAKSLGRNQVQPQF